MRLRPVTRIPMANKPDAKRPPERPELVIFALHRAKALFRRIWRKRIVPVLAARGVPFTGRLYRAGRTNFETPPETRL